MRAMMALEVCPCVSEVCEHKIRQIRGYMQVIFTDTAVVAILSANCYICIRM